jgi:hypothetical protein
MCDYLAIMASSISSKRAFLLASITISKWCNQLDANIVEALQCLKELIEQDLILRDIASLGNDEQDLDFEDEQLAYQDSTAVKVVGGTNDMSWGAPMPDDGNGTLEAGHNIEIDLE